MVKALPHAIEEGRKRSKAIVSSREAHEVPQSFQDQLTSAGGKNRFGEPMFRIVWGEARLGWIGGEWAIFDAHGNKNGSVIEERLVPKYMPAARWYLEKWMPPEHYGSPEAWAETQVEIVDGIRVPNLGPYPSRGEYEMSIQFQRPNGDFAPLIPGVVLECVRMIKAGEAHSTTENNLAIKRAQEKKDRDWNAFADDVLNDENVFAKGPHIYMPKELVRKGSSLLARPKEKLQHIDPRELKSIRMIQSGIRVERPPDLRI